MLGLSLVRRWPVGQCCTEATPHFNWWQQPHYPSPNKANGSEGPPWKSFIRSKSRRTALRHLHWNLHVNSDHDQRRSILAYLAKRYIYRTGPALSSSNSDRIRIQLAQRAVGVQAPRKPAVLAVNLQKPEGSREWPPAKHALHIESTAARRGPGACQTMQPVGLVTSLLPYCLLLPPSR